MRKTLRKCTEITLSTYVSKKTWGHICLCMKSINHRLMLVKNKIHNLRIETDQHVLFDENMIYKNFDVVLKQYVEKIQEHIEKKFTTFLIWIIISFVIVTGGMYLFYIKFPHYFAA